MKASSLQILLIFALFLLPEIFKIFKKKDTTKKYEYPDEQQRNTDMDNTDVQMEQQQLPPTTRQPDLWDILTGKADVPEMQVPVIEVASEAVESSMPTPTAESRSVPPTLQSAERPRVKLSAKSAAHGLIMAEILGKPRALRPMDSELPCRRSYR